MSLSVADIYEDYLESLQNLPSEIDQNMHELRQMDDDLQKFRETYSKHKRHFLRQQQTDTTELEKEYKTTIQKQDQKIELAMRMYDLVSRHIERLDSQVMTKSNLNSSDWIKKRKRFSSIDQGNTRKRIHHSTRPRQQQTVDPNEPRYCYCHQVSFGDMIACDADNCEREWFHYPCVGLVEPPSGKWFCEECSKINKYNQTSSSEEEDDLEEEEEEECS